MLFFFWQVNLADLNSDEDQASKKIRLCIEDRIRFFRDMSWDR